ncbi:DNA topoisomerase IA [Alteracholeplasma palmae J233]|uniref:DNA topoisomerase 1 n=1 Tax=Alteracholeplasma palmae (strain ATCC 49389 / J233) TaxID=1318466 RepID=U4KRC9_ALTPJ|nr:type I DNA topoisomerase [Alteracholeplasma palmae]CCV64051.1 DNA topoisomerase IA [Alteracholeplasma palmae J233]
MADKVIIVESPSKSKTISSYFDNKVTVLSSKGHIRDLAISGPGGLGIDVENGFMPMYQVIKGKTVLVKDLIKQTKGKEVYLATDPDREGEAIAWHLAQVLNLDVTQKNRVIFREITKPAVLKAIQEPSVIDEPLVESQETRRMLDRIIGFKLSSLLQKKIKSKSAGRVQSVALKLIVDLEKERDAFVPEEYHTITAEFQNFKADYIIKKDYKIKAEEAKRIVDGSTNPFTVSKVEKKENKRKAKQPFTTSTLQQDAINNLSMSSSRTMSVAQSLYEGIEIEGEHVGLITYMRTDSTRLSDIFVTETQDFIKNYFGKEYLGEYKVKKSDNAQDAHEGIRPTSVLRTPESVEQYLSKDEFKLYQRIYQRAVSSLMSDAVFSQTKVTLTTNGYDYLAEGVIRMFPGYQKLFDDSAKDKLLPDIKENETYNAKKVEATQKFTTPPARFSEATLIKELEKLGIGRPSTYAQIIKTLKDRLYVELEEKRFKPTKQGILTSDKLTEFFSNIINVEYTSNMEKELDEIAEHKVNGKVLLKDFYDRFIPTLELADQKMEKIGPEVTDKICPLCGHQLVIRRSKHGEFLGCSNFPKCRHTENIETNPENKEIIEENKQNE